MNEKENKRFLEDCYPQEWLAEDYKIRDKKRDKKRAEDEPLQ